MNRCAFMNRVVVLVLSTLILCISSGSAEKQITEWLEKAKTQSMDDMLVLCEEVLNGGEPAILKLCEAIKPQGDDANARVLLHSVVNYACTKSLDQQKALSDTLCKALRLSKSPEVKAFLISELQYLGNPGSIEALSEYIGDEYLCHYAVGALATIGTLEAFNALKSHLNSAQGRCLENIISALGDSRMTEIVPELESMYPKATGEMKNSLLFAIAKLEKNPVTFYNLVKHELSTSDVYQRAQVVSAIFSQLKSSASEKNLSPQHKSILDEMLGFAKEKKLSEVECAVLHFYMDSSPSDVFDLFVRELENESADVRAVALQFLAKHYDSQVKKIMKEYLYAGEPDLKYQILETISKLKDATFFKDVEKLLNNSEETLRLKAIATLVKLDSKRASKVLTKQLIKSQSPKEIEQIKTALLQCSSDDVVKNIGSALKRAKGDQLVAVLQILAERRASKYFKTAFKLSKDKDIKVKNSAIDALGYLSTRDDIAVLLDEMLTADNPDAEAYKNAIITFLEDSGTPSNPVIERINATQQNPNPLLFSILASVCDEPATNFVKSWLNLPPTTENEQKINLAISALSQWDTPNVLLILLDFFERYPQHPKKEEAWKAFIRGLSLRGLNPDDKVWVCEQILKCLYEKTEEILKYLGGISHPDAFVLVSKYLNDTKYSGVASSTLVKIALPNKSNESGLIGKDVIPYLEKAKEYLDDATKKQIDEHIRKCENANNILPLPYPDDAEFKSLFNGRNLEGWEGYTRGFNVEFGKLVCLPTCHLNLFTNKDYSNFILRFEFKLTPGSNNGIGIRTPFMKHAAYDGMEIQILDDSDPSARGLQPWQYHGAIYGVLPPNQKAPLKKCGEWNQEEIIANKDNITVIVNGVKIIDADLKKLAEAPTPDGKNHPGLLNPSGRIGLLGHGSRVEFRNIRIKEL